MEGRDPWGMLYYGVMIDIDKTVRAVMDARSGWGGGGLLEGRDPWGMLYYGVMVDKTVRAVMDARSEGEDGWDG